MMPEGGVIGIMFFFVLSAAAVVVAYCLRLAVKYKRIEADMRCVCDGRVRQVVDIICDKNDWFMRKVRLHSDDYPYFVDKLISEVSIISEKNRINFNPPRLH